MIVAAILLAAAWIILSGDFTPANLALGGGLGLAVLLISGWRPTGSRRVGRGRLPILAWAEFLLFFAWELILANLRLARDITRVRLQLNPALVAVSLQDLNDWQITVLANLITLTPGTLSLDVSPDRRFLVVHTVQAENLADFEEYIRREFERRVVEVSS